MSDRVDVLIVGAGASGLTLACDLHRRGVSYRLVEAAPAGFAGSRAKGIQPRSAEAFDDLGVLSRLQERSTLYPPLGVHLGPISFSRTMIKVHRPTSDVPFPNTLLVPQYSTDLSLRERLEELGGSVSYGTRLLSYTQGDDAVIAELESSAGTESVRARYLVGADGGGSVVRRGAGIAFKGSTDESDRMIVADVTLTGLSRARWHVWPRSKGRFVALCPLPGEKFQLMLKLRPQDKADLDTAAINALVREAIGGGKVQIRDIHWSSVWRPNIRLAEHYRSGRVFLVGDAAHVHPPTGAQGLNTGVQDAYNMGWKLGQVLAGAPETLLDTYEAERQPVAARVLGLATGLYAHLADRPLAATKRGDEERQLTLTYRGGPLAPDAAVPGVLAAGDRAADALVVTNDGRRARLFDLFRGPGFTVLAIGDPAIEAARTLEWVDAGAMVTTTLLAEGGNDDFRRTYRLSGPGLYLIRPDGYIGARQTANWPQVSEWPTLPFFPQHVTAP